MRERIKLIIIAIVAIAFISMLVSVAASFIDFDSLTDSDNVTLDIDNNTTANNTNGSLLDELTSPVKDTIEQVSNTITGGSSSSGTTVSDSGSSGSSSSSSTGSRTSGGSSSSGSSSSSGGSSSGHSGSTSSDSSSSSGSGSSEGSGSSSSSSGTSPEGDYSIE